MATDHNFVVKNGLEVGGALIVNSSGQLVVATVSSNITFQDNVKAQFGASSDLQIFHDGSNSYIKDTGTGSLILEGTTSTQIKGSAFVILRSTAGENMAIGNANGSFDLYYDAVKKLATKSDGVDITGELQSDSLDVDGNADISGNLNTGPNVVIRNGTTYAQSTDYLYIGGSGLDGSDAAIYLGNNGAGSGYGWRFFYEGSGSGNLNKLIIKSENLGSPVDALSFTQDGNATFAGTISSGAISTSANLDMNANSIIDVEQINGIGGTGWLDFNMDTDSIYPESTADNQTVLGSVTHMNFVGDSNANGVGGIFYWGYGVSSTDSGTFTQTMDLDRSGNLTATGSIQGASFSDGTISGITFIDEDSFATNSATRVPTQQSIKAYVDAQVAGVVDTAPAALDTLNELAAALGDDANFSTTTSTALGNRLRVDTASQGLTGTQQANAITNLGITATKAELNFVDGVTSNIQTQLNTKITSSDNITGTSGGLSGTPNITVGSITSSGDIKNGSYTRILTGDSNTGQITFNADFASGAYTPDYNGVSAAGMSVIKMKAGGYGGLEFYVKNHGTATGTHALNTFTKVAEMHQDGYFDVPNTFKIGGTTVTSTAAELNVLDGYTGSVTELNYLDTLHATGVTSTEFDYLDGVTSNIQTQLNGKLSTSGTAANSQLLDNLNSTQFLRSDNADTASGALTYSNTQTWLGNTFWQVSSSDTAYQRADARDDDTDKARLHWYGVNTTGGNTNFRHAWYDGSAYVNVDVASQVVSFSGGLSATTVNTGQGANELYAMNQNVRSSDSPTFANLTVTDNLDITAGNLKLNDIIRINNAGNATFGTIAGSALTITNSAMPILILYDNGNGGGGAAEAKIAFNNTAGTAMAIGYTDNVQTNSDMIISTNAGGTYGGYLGLASGAIADAQADIILEPKTNVRIATGGLKVGTSQVITSSRALENVSALQVGTLTNQNSFGALQVNQSANNDESGIGILSSGAARSMRLWVDETNSYINSGNAGAGNLIFNEAITVSSGGNLTGVGTISASASNSDNAFNFAFTDSTADVAKTAMRIDYNASDNTTLTADRTHIAFEVDYDVSSTGGDTANEYRAYGISIDVRGAGDTDVRRGIYSYSETQHNAGTVTENVAVYGYAIADDTGTGRTTNNYGGLFLAYENGTGSGGTANHYAVFAKAQATSAADKDIETLHGGYFEAEYDTTGATTTITNAYGVRSVIDNDSTDTSVSNSYLFRGEYQGTINATNAYGIYINGNVENYFAGHVRAEQGYKVGSLTVIDQSRNLTNIGTISSGAITASDSAVSSTPLTIGSSAQTSFTKVDWITSAHGVSEAYILAYGAGHSSQAGNFAIKNLEASSDIFFELAGSVEPLRLTSTGATFAGTISSGAITSTGTSEFASLNLGGVTSTGSDFLSGTQRIVSDGYIATQAIYNYSETGSGPAAIVFGNGSTYGSDQISLITNGVRAFYIDSSQNIAVSGTVDGRDLATDGSKLDGISSGADVTPSWVPSSNPGYITSISSSDVTTALGYTPYQESTALSATTGTFSGDVTVNGNQVFTDNVNARVKFAVWSTTSYGIGMHNTVTYGGINNDYAMTFQMNNVIDRGFLWLDSDDTLAQGAMALTTDGYLTVASGMRIGYGKTDTTKPGGGIDVRTTADGTPAIIATNTGGLASIIQRWVGDSDSMEMQNGQHGSSTGDYSLVNTQQDNGILFYDGGGGVDIIYGGTSVQQWDSTGGTDLLSGDFKVGGSTVINSSGNWVGGGNISEFTNDSGYITSFDITTQTDPKYIRSDANDNVTAHTEWNDNFNIRLGSGADLRMWHDGSNHYFRNYNHTNGNFYFQGENPSGINHALLYMMTDVDRPYVRLFEDAVERLRTNSTGVTVTGNITLSNGGHLQTYTDDGDTGVGGVDIARGGHITFYGNNNVDHSIGSRNNTGAITDDLRISSYGALYIDLDSNSNNTSGADFVIGRHGSGDGTMSTLVTISGENGDITTSGAVTATRLNDAADAAGYFVQPSAISYFHEIRVDDYIRHDGDTNTYMLFSADRVRIVAGNVEMIDCVEGGTDYVDIVDRVRVTSGGDMICEGDVVAFTSTTVSDINQKENIKPIKNAVSKVKELSGVTFDWKKDKTKSAGIIAQEVEKVLPEIVKQKEDRSGEEFKSVDYNGIIGLLVETVKELNERIEELEKK